jgi:hypothetical protein
MPIQTVSQAVVNSGSSLGFRNKFINGDMRVNQRGLSFTNITTNGQYVTDRWSIENGGLTNLAYTTSQSTDAPPGFANSLSLTVAAASTQETSVSYLNIRQSFEVQNVDDFGWGTSNAKPVTVSFWIKSTTTSPFSSGIRCQINGGTYVFFKTLSVSVANTWEKKTYTITPPTFNTGFTEARNGIAFDFNISFWGSVNGYATDGVWSTGNLLATTLTNTFVRTVNANVRVTGFQMEVGNESTNFENRLYGTELALCQRYCMKLGGDTSNNSYQAFGLGGNTTTALLFYYPQTAFRTTPSLASYTGLVIDDTNGAISISNLVLDPNGSSPNFVRLNATASGLAQFRPYFLRSSSSTGNLILSAEL